LHIFLGIAPGAGKTYLMLAEGHRLANSGADVLVGLAETHGRSDTEAMLEGMERVPPLQVVYRGATFEELDVDALLKRHPRVALVDELAHRCAPGSRHEKRWEDVEELLDGGIDVVTSLNVQHLDSLNDAVETITGVAQGETVPDVVVAGAHQIDFVDITPERLRARIAHADVMGADAAQAALGGFFSAERLAALRQLGLGWLGEHDLLDPAMRAIPGDTDNAVEPIEHVVVALTGAPEAEHVLRRASHIARSSHGELIGVYVRVPSDKVEAEPPWLAGQRRLLTELGGRYNELAGVDVATVVLEFSRAEGARQLVLGATRRSRTEELLHGSVINKAIHSAGPIEVHVIPARRPPKRRERVTEHAAPRPRRVLLPAPRRRAAWFMAVLLPVAITLGLVPVRSSLELAGVLLCNLLAVVGVALLGGIRPAMLATGVAFVASDFFYAPPFYSLRLERLVDLVALITFLVVAAAVGGLVDLLARQGVRVAQASAQSENLARLAADSMVGSDHLTDAIGSLRRAFDLDGVSLLHRDGDEWTVEAAVGNTGFKEPEAAPLSVELSTGCILALAGSRLSDPEATLLRTFLDQLKFARERALLGAIENEVQEGGGHSAPE
jgi:two-component system sensor histidine kinase KdpD